MIKEKKNDDYYFYLSRNLSEYDFENEQMHLKQHLHESFLCVNCETFTTKEMKTMIAKKKIDDNENSEKESNTTIEKRSIKTFRLRLIQSRSENHKHATVKNVTNQNFHEEIVSQNTIINNSMILTSFITTINFKSSTFKSRRNSSPSQQIRAMKNDNHFNFEK